MENNNLSKRKKENKSGLIVLNVLIDKLTQINIISVTYLLGIISLKKSYTIEIAAFLMLLALIILTFSGVFVSIEQNKVEQNLSNAGSYFNYSIHWICFIISLILWVIGCGLFLL